MKTNSTKLKNASRNTVARLWFFVCLTCSALAAISANTPAASTVATAESSKTIKDYLKFPQILLPLQQENKKAVANKVEVLFTTSHNGKVNFVLVKTGNAALKQEIEKQFYALNLPKLKEDVVHSVVLSFRTL